VEENDRRTVGGTSSAYPILRRPASICSSEWSEVFVPGPNGERSAACASSFCHADLTEMMAQMGEVVGR
jgi:hypothetical protein